MEQEVKRISDSMIEHIYQVRPEHLNAAGRLFGGQLMEWIDEIAGLVGMRHSNGNITTASVDNLRFIRGAYQNDLIVLMAKVTYVGNTSMEIRVDTYVEDFQGTRKPINRAYLTLVAVDSNDVPRKVPTILLETEGEKAEWEAAKRRKELRIQRQKEGF
ncbi:MAG: acyl-CoA thioesterase [Lachnospiraceae bacterium]|nr:acyl-CoA thioesterase [Lachnospiraceae bacterium]